MASCTEETLLYCGLLLIEVGHQRGGLEGYQYLRIFKVLFGQVSAKATSRLFRKTITILKVANYDGSKGQGNVFYFEWISVLRETDQLLC